MTESYDERPNTIPWPPIVYVAAGVAAYGMSVLFPASLGFLESFGGALFVPGLLMSGSGLGLVVWAITTMIRHKANVVPNRAATRLVRDGPFRWSRNPIYLGDTILLAGLGFVFNNPWFFLAALAAAALTHRIAILREEKHMAVRFGEAWEAYVNATARWIGPV